LRSLRLAAAALVAAAAPAAAIEAPLGDAQVEYYDVSVPGGHRGLAQWHLTYTYQPRVAGGGRCVVGSLSTRLELKVTLPRWTPPAGATDERVQRWERYLTALRLHEAGHLQNGREFESGFRQAALAMGSVECRALGAAVQARFDELLEQARVRDREYDLRTRHGATQGAYYQ
jgi:predicted secreted Zn-dependent protease